MSTKCLRLCEPTKFLSVSIFGHLFSALTRVCFDFVVHKERHVNVVEREKHRAKYIFKQTASDWNDTLISSYHKDLNFMDLKDITDLNGDEEEILLRHCVNNYEMIKDIYHWLQARSKIYPWVDNYTFREQFIKRLGFEDQGASSMSKVDVILSQVNFKDRFEGKIDRKYVDLP